MKAFNIPKNERVVDIVKVLDILNNERVMDIVKVLDIPNNEPMQHIKARETTFPSAT